MGPGPGEGNMGNRPNHRKERSREVINHIDRRLLIYSVIFVVLFIAGVAEVLLGTIRPLTALTGFARGLLVGLVLSNMHNITWDPSGSKVTAGLDWLGGIILVIYLVFVVTRNWLFGFWLHGHTLTVFTLTVVSGTMLGRVAGIGRHVRQIITAWRQWGAAESRLRGQTGRGGHCFGTADWRAGTVQLGAAPP